MLIWFNLAMGIYVIESVYWLNVLILNIKKSLMYSELHWQLEIKYIFYHICTQLFIAFTF